MSKYSSDEEEVPELNTELKKTLKELLWTLLKLFWTIFNLCCSIYAIYIFKILSCHLKLILSAFSFV